MGTNCPFWRPGRGRCWKSHGITMLLLLDVLLQCVSGYLSSPHVGLEAPFPRGAQHGPVITSPVLPAASSGPCSRLPSSCIYCHYHHNCTYGKPTSFTCKPKRGVHCLFCWQLEPSQYTCSNSTDCMTVSCPRRRYNASCEVHDHVHCLGRRVFNKQLFCNWTGGYKWSTALALSITLGGFGADRFYLGQWREGLGKLFSFGGLGIWTLIDVLLIGVGYVGPADGSLYI
ncbi:hypothetical protein CRUP_025591 [Coryphaenoides rupestris]|nr:hypothetical protein CRUP_025591 [Coryphaenoides rupestris]